LTAAFVVLGNLLVRCDDDNGDDDDINGVAFDILWWNITGFPGVRVALVVIMNPARILNNCLSVSLPS